MNFIIFNVRRTQSFYRYRPIMGTGNILVVKMILILLYPQQI